MCVPGSDTRGRALEPLTPNHTHLHSRIRSNAVRVRCVRALLVPTPWQVVWGLEGRCVTIVAPVGLHRCVSQ